MSPEILRSVDGRFYYVTERGRRPDAWLEVLPVPGPVPEEKKHAQLEGYVEFSQPFAYHRKVLPFWCFSLRGGERSPIATDDLLYLDYALAQGWTEDNRVALHERCAACDGRGYIETRPAGWRP